MSDRSIVEYFAEHEKYRCGYCGSKDTNYSHGLWAHTMTVQDYQDLIDRGWRRSGSYTYKPTMNQTCCPQYPIRCEVLNFKLSKSQKKTIKSLNKYLNTGIKPCKTSSDNIDECTGEGTSDVKEMLPSSVQIKGTEISPSTGHTVCDMDETLSQKTLGSMNSTKSDSGKDGKCKKQNKYHNQSPVKEKAPQKSPRKGEGADPTKPACKKAKLRRRETKLLKQQQRNPEVAESGLKNQKKCNEAKSLEDHLNDIVKNPVHKLEIRLVRSAPKSKLFEDTFDEEHNVYKNYQMHVHKDPEDKPSVKQYTRFLCTSPLKLILVRRGDPKGTYFKESLTESYEVFKKYQMSIHKEKPEDCDRTGYTRFLVDSPLESESREGGFPNGFGSFHQQYLLDGKIIAVGVIDILPHCISSVYLYYDPEYDFLSLGSYSALREIAFTRYLHTFEPTIIHYYMGFYIHSCPKMRYKGNYYPSFLLCPETYQWFPIEECSPKLDVAKYSRFAESGNVDENGELDMKKLLVLYQRQIMPYEIYSALNQEDDKEEVSQYGSFVGNKCAQRILLYRK